MKYWAPCIEIHSFITDVNVTVIAAASQYMRIFFLSSYYHASPCNLKEVLTFSMTRTSQFTCWEHLYKETHHIKALTFCGEVIP